MSKSVNPGLLYNRFYFDKRYDEILEKDAWIKGLKIAHNKRQEAKKPEKRTCFKQPEFGFSSQYLTGVPKVAEEKVKAHFSLRNHALTTYVPSESVLGIIEGRAANTPQRIDLTTTYPGLLIGLGYNHQVSSEAAINAGFSFDHTTGLPIIPGSSVKGILRSVFPSRDFAKAKTADKQDDQLKYKTIAKAKRKWLKDNTGLKKDKIDLLEKELFECYVANPDPKKEKGTPFVPLPGPARPLFYDALVVDAADEKGNATPVFGPDNITPHHKPGDDARKVVPDIYKEPNPISLLKVMPGVTFAFTFRLPEEYQLGEYTVKPTLAPEKVEDLFELILLTFGVGAKSRVGYGRFKGELIPPPTAEQIQADREAFLDDDFREKDESFTSSSSGNSYGTKSTATPPAYKEGETVTATVESISNKKVYFSLPKQKFNPSCPQSAHSSLLAAYPGQTVTAVVAEKGIDSKKGHVWRLIIDWNTWS